MHTFYASSQITTDFTVPRLVRVQYKQFAPSKKLVCRISCWYNFYVVRSMQVGKGSAMKHWCTVQLAHARPTMHCIPLVY